MQQHKCHIPGNLNLQQNHCENFRSGTGITVLTQDSFKSHLLPRAMMPRGTGLPCTNFRVGRDRLWVTVSWRHYTVAHLTPERVLALPNTTCNGALWKPVSDDEQERNKHKRPMADLLSTYKDFKTTNSQCSRFQTERHWHEQIWFNTYWWHISKNPFWAILSATWSLHNGWITLLTVRLILWPPLFTNTLSCSFLDSTTTRFGALKIQDHS